MRWITQYKLQEVRLTSFNISGARSSHKQLPLWIAIPAVSQTNLYTEISVQIYLADIYQLNTL